MVQKYTQNIDARHQFLVSLEAEFFEIDVYGFKICALQLISKATKSKLEACYEFVRF